MAKGIAPPGALRDATDTGRIGKEREVPDGARTEPASAQTVRNAG